MTSSTVAADYPALDGVLQAFRDVRARNLRLLDEIGDAGLDRPSQAPPPGFEELLRTVGQRFLVIALHQVNHRGQVADARRAAGRPPPFTPGAPAVPT